MNLPSMPSSGFAGLKHWRHDLVAGLQVALLWTPFSLGVALASGAPAIAGLISAIVAGLLSPFLGGSHVTVSGPAAALAPVLLWGMLLLGQGDLAVGYPLVLVAIVLTGVFQLLLSGLRAGQYATMLPATVVEAMLASIGIMIIVRQIPSWLGAPAVPSGSVLDSLSILPSQLLSAQWQVAAVGVISLGLMFALRRKASGLWRWIPAAIVVAAFGILGGIVLGFDASLRIAMPENIIDGIHLPAFAQFFANSELWITMAMVVFTFTMIDAVESVASVKAVDKIDPWRRKSDANKTLRAMGVCNLTSGMIGGLTVIPNAVPSRSNIDSGAHTLWSNLYSGLFLLVFAVALPELLKLIPLAAIAGILIYIGWRLCEPALFVRMLAVGRDRFLVFTSTVVAILLTDLLWGMFIGVAIELMLLIYLLMPSVRYVLNGRIDPQSSVRLLAGNFASLFRNPVIKHRSQDVDGRTTHVFTLGSLVGFNLLPLQKSLERLPESDGVLLRFTESARIVDHTSAEFLQHFEEEAASLGRPFNVEGMEHFYAFSAHPLAARMQESRIAHQIAERDGRAQQMAALAQRLGLVFSPEVAASINRHDFVYLRRGDHRELSNLIHGTWAGGQIRLFDYSHTSAPDYHMPHRHTLVIYELPDSVTQPDFVLTPGHYLERYLVNLSESAHLEEAPGYRLYVPADSPVPRVPPHIFETLRQAGPLYIEIRRGVLLAFSPSRELEDEHHTELLANLAKALSTAE